MELRSVCAGVLCLVVSYAVRADEPPVSYSGYRAVRVQTPTVRDSLAVSSLAPVSLECEPTPGVQDVAVSPDAWEAFLALGLDHQVLHSDLGAWIELEKAQPPEEGFASRDLAWFAAFKNLASIESRHAELTTQYPSLVSRVVIGNSIQNRPIYALKVSAPDSPTNPRSQRAQFVINGTQHAREWIAPMAVMWALEKLVEGYGVDPRITTVMNEVEFLIVPVANPDGYVYTWTNDRYWRKNRRVVGTLPRGVDLNRNWDAFWGLDNTGSSPNVQSQTYRGEAPFSEPESAALSNFIIANPNVRAHIDVHSYGRYLLHAPGWTEVNAPYVEAYQGISSRANAAILASHGVTYTQGPAGTTLYLVNGGAADWSHIHRRAWSWVWELRGTDFVLPAAEIVPCSEEIFAGFLVVAEGLSGCQLRLDFNRDGSVSPLDVDEYFSLLGEGPCTRESSFGCGSLDFNLDGQIDPGDVDAYFVALGEGGC